MYVVWNTLNDTKTSTVRYLAMGSANVMTAQGVSRKFTDGGKLRHVQYIHRVKVTGLTPGQKYRTYFMNSFVWKYDVMNCITSVSVSFGKCEYVHAKFQRIFKLLFLR